MRILHVVPSVGRKSGGLGPVALGLTRAQFDLGHSPEIWCLDLGDDSPAAAREAGVERCLRVWPMSGPSTLGLSLEMRRAALDQSDSFDVVHQHGIWLAQSHVTSLFRSRRGWPTVVAPHGSLDQFALRRSRWKKWLALRAYEYRNLRSASCLHALSEVEAESFRAFGLSNRTEVLPNGISAGWLESEGEPERFRSRFGLPANRRILLFLSRVHPKKGLPMLLDALHDLGAAFSRDWSLVIAGPDEVGHRAEVERQAHTLGLGRSVHFVGPVYGEGKRDAFAAADLFVLPSHSEGAPMAVLEALGASVPVLTTRASPWQELTSLSCGWWVEASAAAIAVALRDALSTTREELSAKGARGKALVADRYTWTAMARRCVGLYSELTSLADVGGEAIWRSL